LTVYTKDSSVAIILLNWNGFEFTKDCIDSLFRSTERDFEIILVDNGSEDGSLQQLMHLYPDLHFLKSPNNLGFTGGNNLGMEYAQDNGFEYILLLNNDTVVERDFLSPLVERLKNCTACAAVQPLIYYMHDREKTWSAGGRYYKWLAISKTRYTIPDKIQFYSTDWITGCAFMVKSSVIKEVGVLDDLYFAYFEDVDWSLRMKKAGYTLEIVPTSRIYHEAGASSKSKTAGSEGFLDPRVHYLNVRNQLFQLRKYAYFPYGLIAWPYHLGKIGLYALYFIGRGRWKKLKAIGLGLRDGINEKKLGGGSKK
jgi:GT2 family glycosyltransferase